MPAGKTIIFHSGTTPAPLDPKAEAGTAAYWGDTKTQALSTFARIKESLDAMKLDFGNVVAMTVYLVGDPAKGGRMDFEGFMAAYTQFFGTKEQPNLPARSTVQVAGLVAPACWSKSKCSWSNSRAIKKALWQSRGPNRRGRASPDGRPLLLPVRTCHLPAALNQARGEVMAQVKPANPVMLVCAPFKSAVGD